MSPILRSSLTILVVDDESAVLDLVKLILETAGYTVLVASNARQALAFFETRDYWIDLLLTDINMPEMSGLELACRVSEIAPRLPMLFMTGYRAENPGTEILRAAGPFSDCVVISKPFTSRELLGEVTGIFLTMRVKQAG
ncbi:MAG: hypothetical protein DMG57_20605 [Acidobacteria bacterium]|nr:MAG: hypothetical protein DMG57_20605 [Acidobacteriota bacterium]